jgi:membrane associated rhomboid family serine protease
VHLRRDRGAVADGQVWRLAGSLVVQDGGWVGAASNLVALALVGVVAERLWGRRRWVVVALASGVGAELWGLWVQPVGAGNSVAVVGLAASVAVLALRRGGVPARVLGATALLGGLVLALARDVHGGAAVLGAAVAVVLLRGQGGGLSPGARRRPAPAPPPGRR